MGNNFSIFERIYTYRQRKDKNERENFLIEILAFCLENDSVFLNKFLLLNDIKTDEEFEIYTQSSYEDLGRPDLELVSKNRNEKILIECKIGHFERTNQLYDYGNILEGSSVRKKHLIYLTRYFENKNYEFKDINFSQIKWAHVYEIIDKENKEITQQFKQYIKDQDMDNSNNFTYSDIALLQRIDPVINKMDELMSGSISYAEGKFGKFSGYASRSTRMQGDQRYTEYKEIKKKNKKIFTLNIGIYWWFEDEEIMIGMHIYIPNDAKKNRSEMSIFLEKKLNNWEFEEWEGGYGHYYQKDMANFILNEEEQIPSMIKYMQKGIDDINKLVNSL